MSDSLQGGAVFVPSRPSHAAGIHLPENVPIWGWGGMRPAKKMRPYLPGRSNTSSTDRTPIEQAFAPNNRSTSTAVIEHTYGRTHVRPDPMSPNT